MKYHEGYQTKIHQVNKLTHKVFKDVLAFNYTKITMSKGSEIIQTAAAKYLDFRSTVWDLLWVHAGQ